MKPYPSVALLEFTDIPTGLFAVDRLLKKAPIGLIQSGTISPGRFLTLFCGSTASVEESYREGLAIGKSLILDSVFLPHVDDQLSQTIFGTRGEPNMDSIAVFESGSVCSMVHATDLALKATDTRLIELRLADPLLHGKALCLMQGELQEVQAASEVIKHLFQEKKKNFSGRLIPVPHEGIQVQIADTTNFFSSKVINLKGETAE